MREVIFESLKQYITPVETSLDKKKKGKKKTNCREDQEKAIALKRRIFCMEIRIVKVYFMVWSLKERASRTIEAAA
jgi:hypothetical protein